MKKQTVLWTRFSLRVHVADDCTSLDDCDAIDTKHRDKLIALEEALQELVELHSRDDFKLSFEED